jgi:hypothetical protein
MTGGPLPRALKVVLGRRRAPRVPIAPGSPVSIVGAYLVNVSPYGMLIHSPLPMQPEAVHRFRLMIEKEQRDVDARVAMCSSEGRHRYDIGLEFVSAPDEFKTQLTKVLGRLRSSS